MGLCFPKPEQTIVCPHCEAKCAFAEADATGFDHEAAEGHWIRHWIAIRYCRTCAKLIVNHSKGRVGGSSEHWVELLCGASPSKRKNANEPVRRMNADLAGEYDQAVACELESPSAAAFLLGRCVSRILMENCEVSSRTTLGPQIDEAVSRDDFPKWIAEPLKAGFLHVRNQSGHIWVDTAGETLCVDEESVATCFGIVDSLMQHYYTDKAKRDELVARMAIVKQEKDAGDQVKSAPVS